MQDNPIYCAAHQYLALGFSVIPVNKEKQPLIKWGKYQTQAPDIKEVVRWIKQFPDMQLGIVTGAISNLVVIDVEKGGDPTPYPKALKAITGGGGFHLYYRHPGGTVKNGIRVAPLVDIRGDGGFVVAPPSISSKGAYVWLDDPQKTELSLYPVELMQAIAQDVTEILVRTGERNVTATKKAGEILATFPALESREEAWTLLQQWNQTELAEPLSTEELYKVFSSIAGRHEVKQSMNTLTLKPFTLKQLYEEKMPPINWLAKGLIPSGMLTAITGESNCYKSFLTLALAQSVATGKPFLGHFEVEKKGKVLIIDEENTRRLIKKRFENMGIEAHEDIIFLSLSGIQIDHSTHFSKLKALIDEIDPVLVVLDSLVRFHSKDENSASEMSGVMRSVGRLASEERAVLFIHHHKKEGFGKNSGSNSVRGSTDIFNALDCHIGIKKNTGTLTLNQHKLRVQEQLDPFNVTVDNFTTKHLQFVYGGVDTSRQDLINETKGEIVHILTEAAGELISRKELNEKFAVSKKTLTEVLNTLIESKVITRHTGAHGAHFYSINGPQDEAPDTDVEEEIPY